MKKSKVLTGILILLNYYLILKSPLPANLEIVNSKYLAFSSVLGLRLLSFTALLMFSIIISRKIVYFTLILLCIPWSLHILNFEITQTVILCFAMASFYLVNKRKPYTKILIFLTLILYIGYIFNLARNPNYHLFINKLKPSRIAAQVDEQQKIEFLATNKQYILPSIVRKASHNKPLYFLKYSVDQLVGYFDIEQWSLSESAYDQLKLSGVAPKPYFILIHALMLPILILSIVQKSKYRKMIILGLTISITTYFLFEKQYLYKSAFIVLPFLALAVADFVKTRKYLVPVVFILGMVSTINYYHQAQKRYTTDIFYYYKITNWIKSNPNEQYIVTDIFGPADLYLKYYLKDAASKIKTENFSLTDDSPKENTVYIGFPTQFTGIYKDKVDSLPSGSELVGEIEGEDQIVSNYGTKLWIVKTN